MSYWLVPPPPQFGHHVFVGFVHADQHAAIGGFFKGSEDVGIDVF